MDISVILAHPDTESFNHAIAGTVARALGNAGHKVDFHDLYMEKFDPLLFHGEIPYGAELPDIIGRHCEEISSAGGIVIIHPNWWGQPPAILKGWVDRVIRPGVAYRFNEGDSGEGVPEGLLKAESAIVFNTSNTEAAREEKVFGDPLERIWKDCIFGLCGVRDVYRRTFGVVVTSTPEQRRKWLGEVEAMVLERFPPI